MNYLFMDESGDLGFDLSKEKTTTNFIITIVYFSNPRKLHSIVKKIHRLKRIHSPKSSSILHAYKETKSIRVKLIASRKDTNKFLNKNFKQYLENNASTNTITIKISVDIKNPQEEKCLQTVDFISWAIFRKYEHQDENYRNIIKGHLIEEGWLYK